MSVRHQCALCINKLCRPLSEIVENIVNEIAYKAFTHNEYEMRKK